MVTRVVDRVDDWDSRSFAGGFHELHDLADEGFSGAVRAGGGELYMISGTVVGVSRGAIEDFADASGTVFEAPSPALPLLAVMQERSDEVRAKYYSEDTPLSEVDRTLAGGGFTGFVELSENVLSGDYFLVYHEGESMAAAFVGESGKLLTGDEAFETADDEVGIYEVKPVDVTPVEIPEPTGGAGTSAAAGTAAATSDDGGDEGDGGGDADESASDAASADTDSADQDSSGDAGSADDAADDESAAASSETAAASSAATAEAAGDASPAETGDDETDESTSETASSASASSADSETDEAESAGTAGTADRAGEAGDGAAGAGQRDAEAGASPSRGSTAPAATADSGGSTSGSSGSGEGARGGRQAQPGGAGGQPPATGGRSTAGQRRGQGSAADGAGALETRSIPSLDPARTSEPETASSAGGPAGTAPAHDRGQHGGHQQGGERGGARSPPQQSQQAEQADAGEAPRSGDQAATGARADAEPTAEAGAADDRVEALESDLADREREIDRLESDLESARTERDDLERELEELRAERDDLAEELSRLEEEVEHLEEQYGAATDGERRLTPRDALEGTDIFVRYHSKGDATLEKAHDGGGLKEDVTDNLRLEKHTQFDAATVAVGGESYDAFLEARPEFQFVRWVVEDLLFEIRDTGHANSLQTLYDAIPQVDRAELNGVIEVTYTEEGQETRTQESFDVVLRDRMGNPLLVANFNDSREGATESMMSTLITAAERVGRSADTFACAFLVTRSFFEPGALETASEATRSGLLSRDKRRSFVNLSRKRGYHLCLVEARNENFHLAVPEL